MTRWILTLSVALAAAVGMLVGVLVTDWRIDMRRDDAPGRIAATRGSRPAPPVLQAGRAPQPTIGPLAAPVARASSASALPSFADVAERLNPAVVSVDATFPEGDGRRRGNGRMAPDEPDGFGRQERNRVRRGAGTGFLIDAGGHLLTNHHVVDGADRIMVGLQDGRRLRARHVGSDPEMDVALLKVDDGRPLPHAPLGNSDALRVGEWVVAIGNPLAYNHTLTVGVVSFLGRKLFDSSLDRYIQTDAAITFGNSGGPLINARGEVVGITTALSSRAANIGFAVPINEASAVLPQLKARGSVSRGYMGIMLRALDPDLQAWMALPSSEGAVVQDVTPGSPGERAGVRAYDVIVSVDGRAVFDHEAVIHTIASRAPGTTVTLELIRGGRVLTIPIKLAERPQRSAAIDTDAPPRPPAQGPRLRTLGLGIRELDAGSARRLRLPPGVLGLYVARVEPSSPAAEGEIARGDILLEINRQPVRSAADFTRLTESLRPGDVAAVYLYRPDLDQRLLHTVKVE